MNREHEAQTDLIDLGAATVETRGPGGFVADEILGTKLEGLSND
jgi:hypothetical protein